MRVGTFPSLCAVNYTTTFKDNCERLCHKLNIKQCYMVSLTMPISRMTKLRLGKPRPPTAPSEMVPDYALGLVLLALPPDSVLSVWPIGHVGVDSQSPKFSGTALRVCLSVSSQASLKQRVQMPPAYGSNVFLMSLGPCPVVHITNIQFLPEPPP